jgi:predicted aminopeptidase
MRSIGLGFLLGALGMLLCGCEMGYLLSQGYHQVRLLARQRSLEDVLADPAVSSLTRERIRLVQAVCEFGEKELGLRSGKSYRSFIQVEGPVVAYVVSACPKDRFEPYTWRFPVVGSFPYKGFFRLEDARREKDNLERMGYDTHLSGASAFSALGWFSDPIYSPMLDMDEAELAYTIFHELVHATVFFHDQVDFNEQLATLVGWQSALKFFEGRSEEGSLQASRIKGIIEAEQALCGLLEELRGTLLSLYVSEVGLEEKLQERKKIFAQAKAQVNSLAAKHKSTKLEALARMEWNNASFLAMWRYRYDVGELNSLYLKSGGDLKGLVRMIISWREQGLDPAKQLREKLKEMGGPAKTPPVAYLRLHRWCASPWQ